MTISTESYKGVRDFYPEDMFIQKYLFDTMRRAVESFGYLEYNASILESTELYKAKSGEEIINEQTYSFKDRGERDVTLRPEMTPTVARMVAAKRRELSFPLRWYSIPNLFRYEKPQRGRLREHWQLNVDIFGVENTTAEQEIITLSASIMHAFGAKPTDYEIRINSRISLQENISKKLRSPDLYTKAIKLLDRKDKISGEDFKKEWSTLSEEPAEFEIPVSEGVKNLIETLKNQGITNIVYSPLLARGFDYYTDIVFEIYDTNPENPRALFGGGRYDDLLSIFGSDKVPAVGFGMGDVTLRDFLEVHNLLPTYTPSAKLYIAHADGAESKDITSLASNIRNAGINVITDITDKKVGDQIKKASKDSVPFVIVVGATEITSGIYQLKNMSTGDIKAVNETELINELRSI